MTKYDMEAQAELPGTDCENIDIAVWTGLNDQTSLRNSWLVMVHDQFTSLQS